MGNLLERAPCDGRLVSMPERLGALKWTCTDRHAAPLRRLAFGRVGIRHAFPGSEAIPKGS
jgi:hypothetical protein